MINFRENPLIEFFICHKRDDNILNNLEKLLLNEKTILDVGCGDGRLTRKIQRRFNLDIQGIDVSFSKKQKIPIKLFDGKKLPFPDNYFDSVFFMDVLHHVQEQDVKKLLKEAIRVAKKSVIIKDHQYENYFEKNILKMADFLGNVFQKTPLPFNFKSSKEWEKVLKDYSVKRISWKSDFGFGLAINQVMYRISVK